MPNIISLDNGRKILQSIAVDIVNHDYSSSVNALMASILDPRIHEIYQPYIMPQRNVLKRVATMISQLYSRPPRRCCDNENVISSINKYAPDLNWALKDVQLYLNAIGDLFVVPYYDEGTKTIKLDLVTPDLVEVRMSRSSVKWIEIKQSDDVKRKYYPDGTIQDGKGPRIPTIFDACPVVWLSLKTPTEQCPWSIGEVKAMITSTLSTGMMEAYRARGHYLRSQRIPVVPAAEAGSDDMTDVSIPVSQSTIFRGALSAVSLADETDQFIKSIQADEIDQASSRGLSSVTYLKNGSDLATAEILSKELLAAWENNKTLMMRYEKQILKNIIVLMNTYCSTYYDPQIEIDIDYIEPVHLLKDESLALADLATEIKLGVNSVERFVALRHPELETAEDISDYIEMCIDSRAKMVEAMRELNAPADPMGGPGKDPELNGAAGPPAVSKPYNEAENG